MNVSAWVFAAVVCHAASFAAAAVETNGPPAGLADASFGGAATGAPPVVVESVAGGGVTNALPGEAATTESGDALGVPAIPTVDPVLRAIYIGDQGARLGSPRGPRELKPASPKKPDGPWHREVEFGATGYRGNTDADLGVARLEAARETEQSRLSFAVRGAYGRKDDEKDRQNASADAGYRRGIGGRSFAATSVTAYHDKIADVEYQGIAILALGYDVVRTPVALLSMEAGPAYVVQKKGGDSRNFAAFRLAESVERKFGESVLLWQRAEILPAAEDTGIYLAIAEAGIESALTSRFRFRTSLQYRYDSDPAEGKQRADSFLAASVIASF